VRVDFRVDQGQSMVSLPVNSALTDSAGIATVGIKPQDASAVGAATVSATVANGKDSAE